MSNTGKLVMWTLLIAGIGAGALWILGGKQAEYSTGLGIDASASSVFPFLTEPERLKAWVTGLTEVAPLVDTEKSKSGSRAKKTVRVVTLEDGKQVQYKDQVIRFEKNVMLSVQSSTSSAVVTSIFQLEPRDGLTFVTYRVKSTHTGIGRIMGPLAKDSTQSRIESEIRKLKQLVESSSSGGSSLSTGDVSQSPLGLSPQNSSDPAVRDAETPVSGQPFSFAK